jgi:hypothetical protein
VVVIGYYSNPLFTMTSLAFKDIYRFLLLVAV